MQDLTNKQPDAESAPRRTSDVMPVPDSIYLDRRLSVEGMGVLIILAGRSWAGEPMPTEEFHRIVGSERKAKGILRELVDLGYLIPTGAGTYQVVLL